MSQPGSYIYVAVSPVPVRRGAEYVPLAGVTSARARVNITGQAPVLGVFRDVSAGDHHVLALGWDGSLWAWGRNNQGQLGLGPVDTTDRHTPTRVGNASNWAQVTGGQYHTLGIRTDGSLWAWGFGARGALGLGPNSAGTGTNAGQVASGYLTINMSGFNLQQLQNISGAPPTIRYPRRVQNPNRTWDFVAASGSAGISPNFGSLSIARTRDGHVYTWGTNNWSQSGIGGTANQNVPRIIWPTPRRAQLPQGNWVSITAGRSVSAAAVSDDGRLVTWGSNLEGEGGRASNAQSLGPGLVAHPNGHRWLSVSAGSHFMVAVDEHGRLWSWGNSSLNRLGRSSGANNAPGLVVFPGGTDPRFTIHGVRLSQYAHHVLAICDEWRMWAWGSNSHGQLGDNSQTNRMPFNLLPNSRWSSASAGSNFSLAVAMSEDPNVDGRVYTWGNNQFGQMGQGSAGGNQLTPLRNPHLGR